MKRIVALLLLLAAMLLPMGVWAAEETGPWILTPEVPWRAKQAARNLELLHYDRSDGYTADAVDAVGSSLFLEFEEGSKFIYGTYYNGFKPQLVYQPFAVYGSEKEEYVYLYEGPWNATQFRAVSGDQYFDDGIREPYGLTDRYKISYLSTTRDNPFLLYVSEAGLGAITLKADQLYVLVVNKGYEQADVFTQTALLFSERPQEILEGEEVIDPFAPLTREDIAASLYRIPEKTNDSLNAQLKKEGYKLGGLTFGSLELGGYETRKTYAIGENKLVIQVKAHESDDGWYFDPAAYAVMGNYASCKKIEPGMTISELKKWANNHLADVAWAMEILGIEKLP